MKVKAKEKESLNKRRRNCTGQKTQVWYKAIFKNYRRGIKNRNGRKDIVE